MPEHVYLYVNRPPGLGCQPDGFTERETYSPPQEREGRWFHGRVVYPDRLSLEEIHRYDLWPASPRERARLIFEREGELAEWLRESYLSQPVEKLREFAPHDPKAWAALVLLGESEEEGR